MSEIAESRELPPPPKRSSPKMFLMRSQTVFYPRFWRCMGPSLAAMFSSSETVSKFHAVAALWNTLPVMFYVLCLDMYVFRLACTCLYYLLSVYKIDLIIIAIHCIQEPFLNTVNSRLTLVSFKRSVAPATMH